MLLGGLWHGASWTFIVWGLLHGGGLAVTRIYQRAARPRRVLAIAGAAFALGVGVEVLGAGAAASRGRTWPSRGRSRCRCGRR
jgi:hypothetical protein